MQPRRRVFKELKHVDGNGKVRTFINSNYELKKIATCACCRPLNKNEWLALGTGKSYPFLGAPSFKRKQNKGQSSSH